MLFVLVGCILPLLLYVLITLGLFKTEMIHFGGKILPPSVNLLYLLYIYTSKTISNLQWSVMNYPEKYDHRMFIEILWKNIFYLGIYETIFNVKTIKLNIFYIKSEAYTKKLTKLKLYILWSLCFPLTNCTWNKIFCMHVHSYIITA